MRFAKASLLALLVLLLAPGLRAREASTEAILTPASGELTRDTSFGVSFPDAVIAAELIGAEDAPSPLTVQPKLQTEFLWQSATEGDLTIKGGVVPGTHYRISTAPGLKDARGQAIAPHTWEFDAPVLKVRLNDDETRSVLSSQPRFELEGNYPIAMADAAEHVFLQDRDSHERHSMQVVLQPDQSADRETSLTVAPRQPLPMGHTFDLVVDGLCDAFAHRPLPFLQVFGAGTTEPLQIQWVGAFNQALVPACIRAKFSETLDPDSAKPEAIRVTPPVEGLKVHADGDELTVEGAFVTTQRYQIQLTGALRGIRGFGLAKEEHWGATFHPKDPTIVFPPGDIFQRSARGLRFTFLQVNTGPVTWKLSSVPLKLLPELGKRLERHEPGEPPLGLDVAGEGHFDANGAAEEVQREIAWQPAAPLSGPYLLEVTAPTSDGHTVGNRALVSFSEYVLTEKRDARTTSLRVAGMSDGRGAAGMRVRAVSEENVVLGTATADANGVASFPSAALFVKNGPSTHLFIAETPAGPAIQYANAPALLSGDPETKEPPLRALVVTDRNLYRPGQTVKMHGIMRVVAQGELQYPASGPAHWQIKGANGGLPIAAGEAPLGPHGSWDAEWNVPSNFTTGSCEILTGLASPPQHAAGFQVEEYRVPLFSVELEPIEQPGTDAKVKVSSNYFHGAPNGGAHLEWSAVWSESSTAEDDTFVRNDQSSEHRPVESGEAEASGEAVLDPEGHVLLTCPPPFKDHRPRGRCHVTWRVNVTSPEAQTFTGGAEATVQVGPAWPGLKAEALPGPKPSIKVAVNALDLKDQPVAGTPVRVELFLVRTHTVKEKIAPFIVRYRNSREFQKIAARDTVTPGEFDFPVTEAGEYVAVLTGPSDVLASTDLTLSGDDFAELPVENETEIAVSVPEPARAYRPGEIAPIAVRAPFAGVAWVSVEAGDVLDTLLVPLAGNAGRIDLAIKKEYAPNATVTVYLLHPGVEKALPHERIGKVQLAVERPDRTLVVQPTLAAASVKPGAPVRGEVLVQSDGAPVAGAEFLVFAVDEAVLKLGDWKLPDLRETFYPDRPHGVSTYAALTRFLEKIDPKSLEQKGYVVGGGGEPMGNVALRKEFKTLAYWKSGLTTDEHGKLRFEFPAPENLTEYRLVAIGTGGVDRFGGGSATFKVSKPLLCEPALPRFVRVGDELQLRAVVRQTAAAQGKVTLHCVTDGLDLLDTAPATATTTKDQPAIFRFKARVPDRSTSAKVRFEASSDFGESDAVEVTVPIRPPSVLRHESFAVRFSAASFQPAQSAPASWLKGRGAFDLTLSTSPWLPRLEGLPTILEYPHGCFEQISTRVLAYAMLNDLLPNLPDAEAREAHYREMLQDSFHRYQEALNTQDLLPYWPGHEGDAGNACVTVLAAWSVRETERAGLKVPAGLRERFDKALDRIVSGQVSAPAFTRCLALFVMAKGRGAKNYAAVAEDLYLRREKLHDEDRALLALALHELNILPREKAQLMKEIGKPAPEHAFDPSTFSSTTREDAIVTLALARVTPGNPLLQDRRAKMLQAMEGAAGLSTQENLYLLLAFKALVDAPPAAPLAASAEPAPTLISKNRTAMAWDNQDLARFAAFQIDGLPANAQLSGLVRAEYRVTEPEALRTDRGLRIERVIQNLTEPKRLGSAEAPMKLGDQILIRYRLVSRNVQYYVALEDLLPAGLETLNPDLPAIAKTYPILKEEHERQMLWLSHSELRDQSTLLYFDRVQPGSSSYAMLARATSAGTFQWPPVQAYPMYDARFSGLSAAGTCTIEQ